MRYVHRLPNGHLLEHRYGREGGELKGFELAPGDDGYDEALRKFEQYELYDRPVRGADDEPPPAILYHYTDSGGLVGMAQSGNIWVTHLRHMNDPSEGDFAATLLQKMEDEEPDDPRRQIIERLR